MIIDHIDDMLGSVKLTDFLMEFGSDERSLL